MVTRPLPLLLLALLLPFLTACGEMQIGGNAATPTNIIKDTTRQQPPQPERARLPDLGGRKLIVGSDTTYPPMEFFDEESRQISGFDVDMMQELGKLLNADFAFQTFPDFDAIFSALARGQFDLVVSSVSVTDERKQIVDFSDPYLSIGQAIATQQSNTSISSVEDLLQARIVGVQSGTTGEQAVRDAGVPEDRIRRYPTIDLAFQDLVTNAIDAVVADGPPVALFTQRFQDLKVVGQPFTTEDYAIALQHNNAELKQALNAGLAELKRNGTFDRLLEKWNLNGVANIPE